MEPQWAAGGMAVKVDGGGGGGEGGGGRADVPGGAGATQFHGVFSADVSVVTHARGQFCPLTGVMDRARVPLWQKNKQPTLCSLKVNVEGRQRENSFIKTK